MKTFNKFMYNKKAGCRQFRTSFSRPTRTQVTKASYHLSALSSSVRQPYLSMCQATSLQQSFSPDRVTGRKERDESKLAFSWRSILSGRKSFLDAPWPLARTGSHGHPLTNQRKISYHIWTLASHDLASSSGPLQPKHRWDSAQKEREIEEARAPRFYFRSWLLFSLLVSSFQLPDGQHYLIVFLAPQTHSGNRFLFLSPNTASPFCISWLFQW